MYSTAPVACKNWQPDTTGGTYLPQNTREASYAIFPIRRIDLIIQYSLLLFINPWNFYIKLLGMYCEKK